MAEYTITRKEYQNLHDAVRNGCLESVRYFLDSNPAVVNQKDESGNTPLLLAICISEEETYNEIVSYLIEKGADVNVYNKGFTPLYNAVFYKRDASIEMLLKAGAWLRPTYRNELHLVAETGGSSIMKMILEDVRCTPQIVNAVDEEGNTALHIAARFHHVNCLKLLVKHGGILTSSNKDNETVLDIIFEQLVNPEHFLIELLNESIIVEETAKYKCCYKLDFSILAPKNCERQMEIISAVLEAASEEQKIEILQNPLVGNFYK